MKIISFWSSKALGGKVLACSNRRRTYRNVTMSSQVRLGRLANNHQHRVLIDNDGICVHVYMRGK